MTYENKAPVLMSTPEKGIVFLLKDDKDNGKKVLFQCPLNEIEFNRFKDLFSNVSWSDLGLS